MKRIKRRRRRGRGSLGRDVKTDSRGVVSGRQTGKGKGAVILEWFDFQRSDPYSVGSIEYEAMTQMWCRFLSRSDMCQTIFIPLTSNTNIN